MDQKLSELVNKVDSEARQFASFDDYLQARENGEVVEWQKPAADAVESSSLSSSEVEGVAAVSSETSSAAPVTVPTKTEATHPHTKTTPDYIANGLKTEPVHPVPNPVSIETPPISNYLAEVPLVVTTLEPHQVEWSGSVIKTVEEELVQVPVGKEPEWWRIIYLAGRTEGLVKLKANPEAIVDRINALTEEIERRKRAIHGLRSALDEALKSENSEKRAKFVGELDMDYRNRRNKPAKERLKGERATSEGPKKVSVPKGGIGIKYADLMAEGMGLRGDALVEACQQAGKLDEATSNYIADRTKLAPTAKHKWGSK